MFQFYRCIFSGNGISADQDHVDCIKNAPRPNSPSEVKSFLGMTGFISHFIPNYSTITEPLCRLTKQDEIWMWTDEQENSFQTLKDTLTSDTIMTYFDPSKETELWVDASPVGLAAILSQENKIVWYASRALSPTEQRGIRRVRRIARSLTARQWNKCAKIKINVLITNPSLIAATFHIYRFHIHLR